MNKNNTQIKCDICHQDFQLTPDLLLEKDVTLHKEGLDPHPVKLTILTCPLCGKEYPVIMDDENTLPILEKLRAVMAKQVKGAKKGYPIDHKLGQKRQSLNWKLDFKRQKLAEKYYESFYQLEDGTWIQLDYRYHAR